MWNDLGKAGPFVANGYFLGVYLVFGFFQAQSGVLPRRASIVRYQYMQDSQPFLGHRRAGGNGHHGQLDGHARS